MRGKKKRYRCGGVAKKPQAAGNQDVNRLELYQMQQSEGTKSVKLVQEKGYRDDLNY